jgi:hypothetical protein
LRLFPLRFTLEALTRTQFPGPAANFFRSALGPALRSLVCDSQCLDPASCPDGEGCVYAASFESRTGASRKPPRPFLIRASHLDQAAFAPGETYTVDLFVFDTRPNTVASYVEAVRRLAAAGFAAGPGASRALARLAAVTNLADGHPWSKDRPPLRLPLASPPAATSRIRILFETPTELKHEAHPAARPEFPVLYARLRARIAALELAYGSGTVTPAPSPALAENIRLISFHATAVPGSRRSARTGQVHPLTGFTGAAEYEGELGPFLPWLRAGQWTGVGRQTVWGHGQYALDLPLP